MGLVRAAARVARGWRQEQVQAAGRRAVRRSERVGRPLRPPAPGRLPGRGPPSRAHHHDPGRHDRPLCRGLRLRRPDRHGLRDQGRPLHRPPLRGIRLGDGQAARRAARGRTTSASTWPTATPAATASSTCRSLSSVGTPARRQSRPLAHRRRHGAALAGRALGPPAGRPERHRARAVPPARARSCASSRFPYARFDIAGVENVPSRGPVLLAVQPPELLRRGRAGAGRPGDRPARALPRQEGDLRRAGSRR